MAPALNILCRALALCALLVLPRSAALAAPDDPSNQPKVAPASDEGERAIKSFRVPKGLKVELFAAEPLLANPVAFCIDETGRFYVAETFRLHAGVTDTRGHMSWLDDDLASRTVEDRVAMYRKHLGARFAEMGVAHDRLRLLEDRDGDGQAEYATVFADGFSDPAVGLGAGVLARKGDVWYTCIPDLWKLRDSDGDGQADVRTSLHRGYGVHVGFIGHDLHGLRFGPDGKLYFSIGDRGLNVTTKDRHLFVPDAGSVLRCNPDGSDLEVFATGLRNPQELVFDEHGDLFTVDNNSDGGDRARLVHVVEGGDSGWRIGYQFIEAPNSRGPWNAEKLWRPRPENQAAYMLPPLANLSDGPSGLTHDPGITSLGTEYRGRFFLADFRGSTTTSGVRSFTLRPDGASFALASQDQFLWGLEATDVDFGPDGALYVSDWVEGWGLTGKGRIYRVLDPVRRDAPDLREVRKLLAEDLGRHSPEELARLLAHPDMRVRREAQFALAEARAITVLERVATSPENPLARLHAIWGLGQVGRTEASALANLPALLRDEDAEVRAQAARVIGQGRPNSDAAGAIVAAILDPSPRVRFQAALASGKLGRKEALPALVTMLRENDDRDSYLRHAAVMGMAGLKDAELLLGAAKDEPASVRLGILLALRRLGSPEVARFLEESDPRIRLEAARAIHDVPIEAAMPRLAALPVDPKSDPAVLRRVLNANVRVGGPENAQALAAMARDDRLSEAIRGEALDALGNWTKPPGRDRVMGLWRPLPERSAEPAVRGIGPNLSELLASAPEAVRRAAAKAAAHLAIRESLPALRTLLADTERSTTTRIEALKALDELNDDQLADAARKSAEASDARLRTEGLRVLARVRPAEAIPAFEVVLEKGSTTEKQGALATLAGMNADAADALLVRWLERLVATSGPQVPPELRLDLVEAAAKRSSPEVQAKLAAYEASRSKDDPLAPYRDTLAGGNTRRGWRIFREKVEVSCLRCHKINGQGGEVGPDLTGIGKRQTREYLLEAIVNPNAKIAEGFETLVVATNDGQVHAGIRKSEDARRLTLITPEGKLIAIPTSEIEERKRGASAMPEDVVKNLTKSEIRDLVEYLSNSR